MKSIELVVGNIVRFDGIFKTEKKYWHSGYTIHGGWFKQLAFTVRNIGVIIGWGNKPSGKCSEKLSFSVFKLI
jgi:hypothetical protein